MMLTTSPLVTAYLADLDRALAGAEPADRLEIVDAVREHIDAAITELGATPTQAQVAGVLRRLGTADDLAAAWAAGADRPLPAPPLLRPAAQGPAPVPDGGPAPPTSRWLVALVVIVGVAILGPLVTVLLGAALFVVAVPQGYLTPGWWLLAVVLIAGTATAAVAWRRASKHRTAWLATCIVAALLTVFSVVTAISSAGWQDETSWEQGPAVVVESMPIATP